MNWIGRLILCLVFNTHKQQRRWTDEMSKKVKWTKHIWKKSNTRKQGAWVVRIQTLKWDLIWQRLPGLLRWTDNSPKYSRSRKHVLLFPQLFKIISFNLTKPNKIECNFDFKETTILNFNKDAKDDTSTSRNYLH